MPGLVSKPLPCQGCTLYGDGRGFSHLEGGGHSGVFAVAEALGENEEEQGLPLRPDGASGKVFRRALRELGVSAETLTISNVIRCRPPGNELWGMPWYYPAVEHCRPYLVRDLRDRKPRVLLALGDVPYQNLAANPPAQLSAVRGCVLESKYDIPLVSTYHPAYIARGAWHLFGAFKHDIGTAVRIAREGVRPLEEKYELHPTLTRVREYLDYLRANPQLPLAYDIETAYMVGEVESSDWRLKRIIQIQFSHRSGYAIVLPWDNGPYTALAKAILALPNVKWSWNGRLADELTLKAAGAVLGGEQQDLMNAWGHLNPSYWGGKDDVDTDKGVPSRLMGLQSATSFYCPEFGYWKHLGTPEQIAANPGLLPYYGAKDADATARCGEGIMASLTAQGLMEGYRAHKLGVRPVLDYLGEIGIPVDRAKQVELRAYVEGELQVLQTRIQALVPQEVLSTHPKEGYKSTSGKLQIVDPATAKETWPKVSLKSVVATYDPSEPPLVVAAGHTGYLKQREFKEDGDGKRNRKVAGAAGEAEQQLVHEVEFSGQTVDGGNSVVGKEVRGQNLAGGTSEGGGRYVNRWYIERLYNPHGSSPNTKAYIRAMGYPMPKRIGTMEDTTGKNELAKLAKATGDPVLTMTSEWREMAKVGKDYTSPKWEPGPNGRVHATFKFGTASDQLVATDPPVMTYPEHSDIAKKAKGCIVAQPGHVLVKIDKRGFHSRYIGWFAKDRAYYELADSDVHSFITAHFLRLPGCEDIFDLEDGERRAVLERIKNDHKFTRNYQVKRSVHGSQFGMGVNKLYEMYAPNFDPPVEAVVAEVGEARWASWDDARKRREISLRGFRVAKSLRKLFEELFPMTFLAFPEWVREQITEVTKCRLVSPMGSHRYFYDYDMQQATAYLPSNTAHRDFQASNVRLYHSGDLQRFEAINSTHDALWFHPLEELAGECIAVVQAEFNGERVIPGWENNPLGPFYCNSDAEVGYSLDRMEGCTAETVGEVLRELKEKRDATTDNVH